MRPRIPKNDRARLPNLTKICDIDIQLAEARKPSAVLPEDERRKELRKLHLKQGGLRSDLGLVQAGLRDCLRALLNQPDEELGPLLAAYPLEVANGSKHCNGSAGEHARTAEAVRLYVRDALLADSGQRADAVAPEEKNLKWVQGLLGHAIAGFEIAEEKIAQLAKPADDQAKRARNRQLGWIAAHRAATHTLLVWLSFLNCSPAKPDSIDESAFDKAADAYSKALALLPHPSADSLWCIQFEAFLYALRGTKDSYKAAREKLEKLKDAQGNLPSGIHRSRAMLSSYVAANPTAPAAERAAAARDSIESGLSGAPEDSEDDKVLYYCAASCWALMRANRELAEGEKAEQQAEEKRLQADLQRFIESAETRALDQASQSLIVLIGLQLLKGCTLPEGPAKKAAFDRASKLGTLFDVDTITPGLEAQAMFVRDPVFTTLMTAPEFEPYRGLFNPHFNSIKAKFPTKLQREIV